MSIREDREALKVRTNSAPVAPSKPTRESAGTVGEDANKAAVRRTFDASKALRDGLAPRPHINVQDGRPCVNLPDSLGSIEVYADTPEYANWLNLEAVHRWLQAFSADLDGLRMTTTQAVEHLDSFLIDPTIPENLRRSIASRLHYLRAGLNGEPGVVLGMHMTALRLTVDESKRVASSVTLPMPPGPDAVARTEGTGKPYGFFRSENH